MEFTLLYNGELPPNGGREVKQKIRRELHNQLRVLWTQEPLAGYGQYLRDASEPEAFSNIRRVGLFRIAPLVCEHLAMVAELELDILRPEPAGRIVTQGGDIDNRLKTLLDALRMPRTADELPRGETPKEGEDPFFCLLEDDSLITALAVRTDRWLDDTAETPKVDLRIRTRTRLLRLIHGNIGL